MQVKQRKCTDQSASSSGPGGDGDVDREMAGREVTGLLEGAQLVRVTMEVDGELCVLLRQPAVGPWESLCAVPRPD